MRGFFLVLGYLIGGGLSYGFAQPSYYANPFIEQIEHYPQEKLHVSTDKDSYIAGDTIWLRAHCADAASAKNVKYLFLNIFIYPFLPLYQGFFKNHLIFGIYKPENSIYNLSVIRL